MFTFRAPESVGAALNTAAADAPDKPSRSELIRRIVTEWLTKGRYLK